MNYIVRHVTRFRYSVPVTESAMEVRMQPRLEGSQHCMSFDLTTNPGSRIMSTTDYLGNIVHYFDVPIQHNELSITAQALVAITPQQLPHALEADAWNELDALIADSDVAEMLVPSHFANPTALLRGFQQEIGITRRDDPLTLVRQVNDRVHGALRYTPLSTKVDSPIDEALQLRQGVCQDYSHIMIALLRELGIPSRYVSGYLYRPTDDPERVRIGATHAWIEALLPGLGWAGFDPTNNTAVVDRHIKVAVGRDYADVPPTRGVFKGKATTELGVAVQVVRSGERLTDDNLLLVMQPAPSEQDGEQPQQQQQVVSGQWSVVSNQNASLSVVDEQRSDRSTISSRYNERLASEYCFTDHRPLTTDRNQPR